MKKGLLYTIASFTCVSLIYASPVTAEPMETALFAGAAKIDVTPEIDNLPTPLNEVNDPLYIRALYIESLDIPALIIAIDVPAIAPDIFSALLETISNNYAIPEANIILSVTHTHNSLRVANPGPSPIPTSAAFTKAVKDGTLEVVKDAISQKQAAKYGFSTAQSSLIVSRNEWLPNESRYVDGTDRTGLEEVDQTFGILHFESLSDKPIAAVLNLGIQPVVFEPAKNIVSGDVPGATSNYVEAALGEDYVALFTVGAPASPAYRVWSKDKPSRTAKTARTIMNAMGVILGEESLAQIDYMTMSEKPFEISSAVDSFTCSGKKTTPRNLKSHCDMDDETDLPACIHVDEPFPDVKLSLGVLRLGDLAYLTSDSNVTPALWNIFKAGSTLAHPQLVGTNFGPFRFVVNDAAYALNTYPATDTRAQSGCAQSGFISTLNALLQKTE